MVDQATADLIGEQLSQHKPPNSEIEQRRANIDEETRRVVQWQQRIAQAFANMRVQQQQLDIALAAADDTSFATHLAEQWSQLRAHPKLASASLEDGTLTLTTTDDIRLHAPDRDDTRWLGAFRIVIDLRSYSIALHNLNTRHGGHDHPHVINGAPCFGSNANAFARLQANGDLFTLFELLIQYLETINLEDEYGRFGAYWFEQEDARPEGVRSFEDEYGPLAIGQEA